MSSGYRPDEVLDAYRFDQIVKKTGPSWGAKGIEPLLGALGDPKRTSQVLVEVKYE